MKGKPDPNPRYSRRVVRRLANEYLKERAKRMIAEAERDQLRRQLEMVYEYSRRSMGTMQKIFETKQTM